MRKNLIGMSALAMIGGLGLGAVGSNVVVTGEGPGLSQQTLRQIASQAIKPTKGDQQRGDMRSLLGSGLGGWGRQPRRAGYGWTNRHAQQVAKKKRNVARHRKASRG